MLKPLKHWLLHRFWKCTRQQLIFTDDRIRWSSHNAWKDLKKLVSLFALMIKVRTLEGREQQWLHNFHAPKEKASDIETDIYRE